MIMIGIAIKIDSKGSVLYKQERLGKNGKSFTLYKFRSMHMDAEKNGLQWAEANDPRVTRVGRFLRNTHLDEIPQLINIITGDMSIIGPRPERAEFYKCLSNISTVSAKDFSSNPD
jgi:lipopolysaccharide/colanic/teichoic acid biosynthesis glycosyltransferase